MNGCPLHGEVWCTCNWGSSSPNPRVGKQIKHFLIKGGKKTNRWCQICDQKFNPPGPTDFFCEECETQLKDVAPPVRALIEKLAKRVDSFGDEE